MLGPSGDRVAACAVDGSGRCESCVGSLRLGGLSFGISSSPSPHPHQDRDERHYHNPENKEGEVVLDDWDAAKEVPGNGADSHPEDSARDVVKQEPAVLHPSRLRLRKGRRCGSLARNALSRIVFPPCLSKNRCVDSRCFRFTGMRGLAVILSPKKCPIQ